MDIENERPIETVGPTDLRDALLALSVIPPVLFLRYSFDLLNATARVASGLIDASPLRGPVIELEARWKEGVAAADSTAGNALEQVVGWVLDRLDLDEIVAQRVDVEAIVDRVDVEATINRVDVVAIANRVISELHIPEIVRDSSQTMAAETVDGLRLHGMNADRSLSEFIDRVLKRRSSRGSPDIDPSGGVGQTT